MEEITIPVNSRTTHKFKYFFLRSHYFLHWEVMMISCAQTSAFLLFLGPSIFSLYCIFYLFLKFSFLKREKETETERDLRRWGLGRKKTRRKLGLALKMYWLWSHYLTLTGTALNIIIYKFFFKRSHFLGDNPEMTSFVRL